MKQWQLTTVIAVTALTGMFTPGPQFTVHAQPRLTPAQAAALQPTPAALLPKCGNFYSLSFPSNPPTPSDPYPDLPVYRLPDGTWLVDDTSIPFPPPGPQVAPVVAARSLLTQQNLTAQRILSGQISLDSLDGPPPLPNPTNSPPAYTPPPPQLLAPGSFPTNKGTYWLLAESNSPPYPYDPCPGSDVYGLSDGSYLVDDTGWLWPPPSEAPTNTTSSDNPPRPDGYFWLIITGVTNSLASVIVTGTVPGTVYTILSRQSLSPTDPWDAEQEVVGAAGQNWTPTQIPTFGRRTLLLWAHVGPDTPQRLWLQAIGISQGRFNCILHGTSENQTYSLLSTTTLHATNDWAVETNFLGTAGQFWTPVSIPLSARPSLLLSARSWIDSTGSGIPDWWLLQYFGRTDLDPYSLCPSQDGWTLLQAYQNGWNPANFYAPPPPQGLTVKFTAVGAPVVVSWNPSPGSVTSYTLERFVPDLWEDDLITNLTQTTFVDSFQFPTPTPGSLSPGYRVQAHYGLLGDSAWSDPVLLYRTDTAIAPLVVRGPQGRPCVVVPAMPPNVARVRLMGEGWYGVTNFDLPIASFTNGIALVPQIWDPASADSFFDLWWLQTLDANGIPSTSAELGGGDFAPFMDARSQLTNNLAFLLRDGRQGSFGYYFPNTWPYFDYYGTPSEYSYAGLYELSRDSRPPYFATLRDLQPFQENYFYRNFVFATTNVDPSGSLTTGSYYSPQPYLGPVLPGSFANGASVMYVFHGGVDPAPIPDLLTPDQARWSFNYPFGTNYTDSDLQVLGIHGSSQTTFSMDTGVSNWFGLPYVSAVLAYGSGGGVRFDTLYAGGSVTGHLAYIYGATAQPVLSTTNYYFCRPSRYFWRSDEGSDPFPGQPDFSPTNATPLMIASVGQPFAVAGYAKQLILNGDRSKFAYLGQYFDKAYQADSAGMPTANETGVLSEYGEFLPTEPGVAVLTTKPDLTQTNNAQGQCPINVLGLALDANGDGTIDPAFTGQDTTSQIRPFVFWLNNDYDRLWKDSDDGVYYEDSVTPGQGKNVPDCNYYAAGTRVIPTKRDLEDYARLWVCGVTSNLLSALPPGTTATLSWGDVGNPNSNNPTIDLFQAADADGGIGYLTNEVMASIQTNAALFPYVGRVAPGGSIDLSSWLRVWPGHFIWCGVTNGTGALTLTISQGGTNTLAQTSAYIQLQDIKQMYERWTIGDNPELAPTNTARLAQEDVTLPFSYGPSTSTNTPYILFVHGWNMSRYDKDCFAERAFKRLYWQGYRGRFGSFRWPTENGFTASLLQLATSGRDNFDRSEYTAWKSGAALLNKLNDLNGGYPGHVYLLAHSMGNIVAGEALRLAGANQVVNTYVASQAAVSAHTYDTNVPNYSFYYSPWVYQCKTPNIYGNWFQGNYGGGAGTVVNFYNTNDYALQRSVWQLNQLFKPDQFVLMGGTHWDYSYVGMTNDPAPWNHFEKLVSLGFTTVDFDIVNVLTNRYEVMALAAESWTTAFGATPGVQNIRRSVDLSQLWPPDLTHPTHPFDEHFYHSAEFRGDYWQQQGYWRELLGSDAFKLR